MCCGGGAKHTYPEMGKILGRVIVEKARQTGADYLASVCPGCDTAIYTSMTDHPFVLRDIVNLVCEAMGGREYEDKLAGFWRYRSIDRIIEESRETFEANGFTEEDMREILPTIFPF